MSIKELIKTLSHPLKAMRTRFDVDTVQMMAPGALELRRGAEGSGLCISPAHECTSILKPQPPHHSPANHKATKTSSDALYAITCPSRGQNCLRWSVLWEGVQLPNYTLKALSQLPPPSEKHSIGRIDRISRPRRCGISSLTPKSRRTGPKLAAPHGAQQQQPIDL